MDQNQRREHYLAASKELQALKPTGIAPVIVELAIIAAFFANAKHPVEIAKHRLEVLSRDAADQKAAPVNGLDHYLERMHFDGIEESCGAKHANALLTIIAINDQFKDREEDQKAGKANIFGELDDDGAAEVKEALVAEQISIAQADFSTAVNDVLTIDQAVLIDFWAS